MQAHGTPPRTDDASAANPTAAGKGSRDLQMQTLESVCARPDRGSVSHGSGGSSFASRRASTTAAAYKADPGSRFVKGTNIKKPVEEDAAGLKAILLHPMNLLLLFLPFGVYSSYSEWDDLITFWCNFFALVPLAKILGDATEELSASLKNDMLAGLLNATFGNAVEVVITINSLRAGLLRIVKSSLLGSVLSNTLLVLGMSFLCGGIFAHGKGEAPNSPGRDDPADSGPDSTVARLSSQMNEKIQSFSLLGALVNTSMLLVSCMCFSMITCYSSVVSNKEGYGENMLMVSRISSAIIIMAYVAYVVFQLVTHREALAEKDDDEGEEASISFWASLALLFLSTGATAYISELLVEAIGGVTDGSHLSEHFIGIVLLPIVGNACEHAAAVRFAVEDKLGLSVSIAVGSSTQIALFVVPVSVVAGWMMDQPMDLNFGILNSSLITLSVVVVLSMVVDGQSNWLQGYLLCSVYAIIAVMYWNLPNKVNDGSVS